MREYGREISDSSFDPASWSQLIRAVAAIVGVIVMIIGVFYATRLFRLVVGVLRDPGGFQGLFDEWAAVLGGEQLDVLIGGVEFPVARILALAVLGGGALVLARIAMGLIAVGAKAVASTLSDRDAIKSLLVHAFGPSGRPAPRQGAASPQQ